MSVLLAALLAAPPAILAGVLAERAARRHARRRIGDSGVTAVLGSVLMLALTVSSFAIVYPAWDHASRASQDAMEASAERSEHAAWCARLATYGDDDPTCPTAAWTPPGDCRPVAAPAGKRIYECDDTHADPRQPSNPIEIERPEGTP